MELKKMALAGLLSASLLMGALPAVAHDRDDKCGKRVRKAEIRLHDAERKHGEHSRQAEKRRAELDRERANCHLDRDHDRR